jgi:anaerobic dimethyl sulfoxide reductase subunit C
MRERSLVGFTLLAQTAVGLFWALAAVGPHTSTPLLLVVALAAAAAGTSLLHLGSPGRAWRALGNLRASWLSREILFLALFSLGAALLLGAAWLGLPSSAPRAALAAATGTAGAGLVYSMARVYRLRTVPAWDTPLTTTSFFLTAASLGGLAAGTILALEATALGLTEGAAAAAARLPVLLALVAIALELALEPTWGRARLRASRLDPGLTAAPDPPAVRTWPRVPLLSLAIILAGAAVIAAPIVPMGSQAAALILALVSATGAEILGRSAFYGAGPFFAPRPACQPGRSLHPQDHGEQGQGRPPARDQRGRQRPAAR